MFLKALKSIVVEHAPVDRGCGALAEDMFPAGGFVVVLDDEKSNKRTNDHIKAEVRYVFCNKKKKNAKECEIRGSQPNFFLMNP